MKKIFIGALLLGLSIGIPVPTMAGVDIGININLPPLIAFSAPPEVVVLPGTDVYVDPDINDDMYFYDGWWWRSWDGRWYRSQDYSSGWIYYESVPSFYIWVPLGWRDDYRNHRWEGNEWNYQRIPHQQLQQNWNTWEKNRYWEKQNSWGVKGYKPKTRSQLPSQSVQPQSQTKPQSREITNPQQSRPKSKEVEPQSQSRPQSEETMKSQQPKSKAREVQQQSQTQPQVKEATEPSRSKSKKVQQQKATKESNPQDEKSKGGGKEKQNNN